MSGGSAGCTHTVRAQRGWGLATHAHDYNNLAIPSSHSSCEQALDAAVSESRLGLWSTVWLMAVGAADHPLLSSLSALSAGGRFRGSRVAPGGHKVR